MFEISKDKLLLQSRIDPRSKSHNGNKTYSKYKNAFLSDFERILFSSSLRRLQDKAQVYPLEMKDFARTRLTHSLEVSSLANSLGNIIVKRIHRMYNDLSVAHKSLKVSMNSTKWIRVNNRINQKRSRNIKSLQDISICLQCAALLHDIGNPPFGHFGEDVIKKYFFDIFYGDYKLLSEKHKIIFDTIKDQQMINDLVHFDGNAQTIRIVTKLQNSTSKKYGLNLTLGVIGTLFKYPFSSINATFKHEKFGYLYSENDLIIKLKKFNKKRIWSVYQDNKRNPLSLIMEASDDIACTISDFDDAIQKGNIKFEDIYYISKNINKFTSNYQKTSIERSKKFISSIIRYYNRNAKKGIIEPLRNTVSRVLNKERENFKESVAECFINNYDDIMNGNFNSTLIEKSDEAEFYDFLYQIKKQFVFSQEEIIKAELQGKKIINFLLAEFLNSALHKNFGEFIFDSTKAKNEHHKVLQLISKNYVDVYKKSIENKKYVLLDEELYFRIRMIIDHICGMTDSYAKDAYISLMGNK